MPIQPAVSPARETVKQAVLDFIDRYGCEQAPDEEFDRLARLIFAFQFANNVPYRAYCTSKRVTPPTLDSWSSIPPMPVDGFKMLTLTSTPEADCEAVFTTSGTTRPGQKGRNFHPDLEVWDASMIGPFRHFILPDRERIRIGVISPAWDMNEHSSLSRYLTRALEQCGAEGSDYFFHEQGLEFDRIERFLEQAVTDDVPVMLMGASSAYWYLLEHLRESGRTFVLPDDSRLFDTGGFKSTKTGITVDDMYAMFADVFGVDRTHCVNMYGMTELSSQIYDQNLLSYYTDGSVNTLKATPAWVRSVMLDPQTLTPVADGETGVIAHYDLANWNSCLAILTEDLGVRSADGYRLLGRAKGAEARGCSITVDEVMAANA
ncbi:CoF synthetase [Bifidobacterium primatium]|uniref:CoF synthetase n=1 Tax=Bifidobacterium primatium TaxID=2045438 RepID=A0A2M9H7C4_9BIFI|nr:CoF synthetase [Bifidobacterium primatium]PJM72695.1 CoF synthetase [Bifidobacterium primatium]